MLDDDEVVLAREIEDPSSPTGSRRVLQVSAAAVRAFVLQEPVCFSAEQEGGEPEARVVCVPTTGLFIRRCVVRGALDLDNACRPDGGALPPLAFDNCIFFENISMVSARFRQLTLISSRITWISASGLHVDGPVTLSFLSSSETDPVADMFRTLPQVFAGYSPEGKRAGVARITLAGSRIGGDLHCDRATLSSPRGSNQPSDTLPSLYALDVSRCLVDGWFSVQDAELNGGLNAEGIKVTAGFVANGSCMVRPRQVCLSLGRAEVKDGVWLNASRADRPFTAVGTLSLGAVRVTGSLYIQGALVSAPPTSCGHVLHLNDAHIGGDVFLSPCGVGALVPAVSTVLHGAIEFSRGHVAGDMNLSGLCFEEVDTYKSTFLGRAMSYAQSRINEPDAADEDLGGLSQALHEESELKIDRREVINLIEATNTTVGGLLTVQLSVSPEYLDDHQPSPRYARIDLTGVTVGRMQDYHAQGWGKNVVLVLNEFKTIIPAERVNRIFNVLSRFRLLRQNQRTQEAFGELVLFLPLLACLALAIFHHYALALLLLAVFEVVLVALVTVQAASARKVGIDTSGISSLKAALAPFNRILGRGDHIFFHRHFLDRQFYDREHPYLDEFSPGVYDSLAKQLREAGLEDESRGILTEKYRIQRKVAVAWYAVPFWWLFDLLFGHGFSAARALATFFACLGIGAAAVHYANTSTWLRPHRPVLVVSTTTVNTLALYNHDTSALQPSDQPYAITLQKAVDAKARPAGEILCGRRIDSRLYALELFVPALDLHQTSQCEVSSSDEARGWRAARAGYTILGWIVTSITLLTVPGILRRRAEE